MLRLHGFSSSNYYNLAKLALLEKKLPFEEVLVYTGADETHNPEYLDKSPLGKVPCLETEEGFLSESRCIVDYLESAFPAHPLYPADRFARAKLLELTQIIDLYLELPARRLLPNYFAKKEAPPSIANDVQQVVSKGVRALVKLARFDTYALGDRFSAADIAFVIHAPGVRRILQSVLNVDPLNGVAGLDAYLARIGERETVKKVRADHDANVPQFLAHLKKRYALGT